MHLDRVEFEYNAINDFRPLPAHLERPVFEADPGRVPQSHHLRRRAGQPGPVLRALSDHRGVERRLHRARAEPDLVGRAAAVPAHRGQGDREHRGARSQSAVRQHRHDRGRAGPDHRPGAGVREAPRRSVQDRVRARPDLRAHRSQSRQPDPGGRARAQGADHGARSGGDQPAAVRGPPAGGAHQRQSARLGAQRRGAALPRGSRRRGRAARRGRLAVRSRAACGTTLPASRSAWS